MSSFERIMKLDTRWLYVVILILIIAPTIWPMDLPIAISSPTRIVYNTIEDVPKGSLVILTTDYGTLLLGEDLPMTEVFLAQLLKKDVKIVIISFMEPSAALMTEQAISDVNPGSYGKKYGVDYVNLGFYFGNEPAIAAFAADPAKLAQSDYHGTPISQLPIMNGFHQMKDIALAVSVTGGSGFPEFYIRQWRATYGTKLTGGTASFTYSGLVPYVTSGQLSGYLGSLRQTAEYELLVGRRGVAVAAMDSQTLAHVGVFTIIVLVNVAVVGLYIERRRAKKER